MRVALDTNVLISALVSTQAAPAAILDLWRAGEIELIFSFAVLAEYQRVLTYSKVRKRLSLTEAEIDAILLTIAAEAIQVEPGASVDIAIDDPSDNKFIELNSNQVENNSFS
jgi:uncharacterized protein